MTKHYPLYTHGKSLWAIILATILMFMMVGQAFAFGDIINKGGNAEAKAGVINNVNNNQRQGQDQDQFQGQFQGQRQNQRTRQNQANNQETTFEAGRYGTAPSIALGGYGFGAALQNCYAIGRGKVGSAGGSIGIASNGITGGGGLFSYGTNYSLAFLECVNDNRIVLAAQLGDVNAVKVFKCMSVAWRLTLPSGTCADFPVIEKMAIDPEEDSFESALSIPTAGAKAGTASVQPASFKTASTAKNHRNIGDCWYGPKGCEQ